MVKTPEFVAALALALFTGKVTAATSTIAAAATQIVSGTNPGPTLVSGWYYVRAVAAPNYHSYLQTKPTGVASDAFLDNPDEAGQFNIVDGQLVYNTGAGGELYMHVENPTDKTQRKLETWFAEEENDYGTFSFQGDTVTWSVSDITRPNVAAWLVCEEQQLFINTGAYAYETPEGCADQTVRKSNIWQELTGCANKIQIHSYGGSTPDV